MTTSSNYIPVRQDWLDRLVESALEPELPIFDAHHHLWDRPGWRYLFEDLLHDIRTSGHRVIGTAFMQCQAMYRADGPQALRPVGETEFVNGVAAMSASGTYGETHACAAIIGHADLRLGSGVEPVLEAHLAAGGGRFRGVRHITTWDADISLLNPLSAGPSGMLGDDQFRQGLACLAPLGLLFEAWLFHPQLPELTDLARTFPDTTIVLNHCGGVLGAGAYGDKRDEVFRQWSRSMTELARCPNVHVKLGGLGMRINGFGFERGDDPPTSEQLADAWHPYIQSCIEAFGAKRCLFESNFPVDKPRCTTNAFRRVSRLENEAVLDRMSARLAARPDMLRQRRESVERPFGTIKQWMNQGAFLMRRLDSVRGEFSLTALAYNIRRAISLVGVSGLMAAAKT